MQNFFVSSTGTEIGKTIVSELFVNTLLRHDASVGYYKPVASGCESSEWGYRSPDEIHIIEETPLEPSQVHATYRFDAPLSPDKAAEREDASIEPGNVIEDYSDLSDRYETLVVEGIGGVAVPFSPDYDVSDLAADLDLPVVLVVSSHLGTISHTRTAEAFLDQHQVETAGILLTPAKGRDIETTNRDHLREFHPECPVRLIPDLATTDVESVYETIEETFLRVKQP